MDVGFTVTYTIVLPGACESRKVVQRSVKPTCLTVVEYHKLTMPKMESC